MRTALIPAIGLAAVLVFATSAAAHRGAFFGRGFGAPVHPFVAAPRSPAFFGFRAPVQPFVVKPRSRAFLSFGFGAPVQLFVAVPPVLVAPPVIVTPFPRVSPRVIVVAPPTGFVPHAVVVIMPRRF
jgi:hypothetical protein